jgi:hypothetical protein
VTEAQVWAEHFEDPTWDGNEPAPEAEGVDKEESSEEGVPQAEGVITCLLDLSVGTSEVSVAVFAALSARLCLASNLIPMCVLQNR